MNFNEKRFAAFEVEGEVRGIWMASLESEEGLTFPEAVTAYYKAGGKYKRVPGQMPWGKGFLEAVQLWGGNGSCWVFPYSGELVECRDCQNPGEPPIVENGDWLCSKHSQPRQAFDPQSEQRMFSIAFEEDETTLLPLGLKIVPEETEGAMDLLDAITAFEQKGGKVLSARPFGSEFHIDVKPVILMDGSWVFIDTGVEVQCPVCRQPAVPPSREIRHWLEFDGYWRCENHSIVVPTLTKIEGYFYLYQVTSWRRLSKETMWREEHEGFNGIEIVWSSFRNEYVPEKMVESDDGRKGKKYTLIGVITGSLEEWGVFSQNKGILERMKNTYRLTFGR